MEADLAKKKAQKTLARFFSCSHVHRSRRRALSLLANGFRFQLRIDLLPFVEVHRRRRLRGVTIKHFNNSDDQTLHFEWGMRGLGV